MAVKYLAGNRLWGTDAERLTLVPNSITENFFNTSNYTWTTAGDSGNTITNGDDPTGQGASAGTLSTTRRSYTTIPSGNTKTFVWKFTWARGGSDEANNSILTLANFLWNDCRIFCIVCDVY